MGVLKVRLPGGPCLPVTGVGTNPGITQDQADGRYVNITGDSMTGPLTMNGPAATEQIRINGAASYVGFWNGAQREGYIQGNTTGLYLASDVGDLGLNAPGSIVAHKNVSIQGNYGVYFAAWGGGWYMSDGDWVRVSNHKNVHTNGIIACEGSMGIAVGGNTGGYKLNVGGSSYLNGNVTTGHLSTIAGYRLTTNGSGFGGGWGEAGVIVQQGAGAWENRSFISYHIPGYWAGGFGSTGVGGFGIWNNGSTGLEQVSASAFITGSSRRFKQDIKRWEPARSVGAGGRSATNRLSLIDVVEYRQEREEALTVPTEDGGSEQHVCGVHCEGSEADPCPRVLDWLNPHLGIIIEDLATVLPEAVGMSSWGKPEMMRLGSMIGFLLAVCKEQQERIEMLEHQEAA